jgi:hypothetical protein
MSSDRVHNFNALLGPGRGSDHSGDLAEDGAEIDFAEVEVTAADRPCITRTGMGFSEDVTLVEFARAVIQDDDAAASIASKMLEGEDPYVYNAEEPEFYEQFSVLDNEALQTQLLVEQFAIVVK